MAAGHSVVPARWRSMFDQLTGRIAGRFARVEPRRHATALVLGLLADLPRKNCWTLAEHAGDSTPDGMQHLLHRAKWDADAVRDDVRAYVVEHLADDEAVLVVDETGDLKKGTATVGVQRQYTGTAGRIENSQVAVYLVYSAACGHAAIDRALYIPRSWTDDLGRQSALYKHVARSCCHLRTALESGRRPRGVLDRGRRHRLRLGARAAEAVARHRRATPGARPPDPGLRALAWGRPPPQRVHGRPRRRNVSRVHRPLHQPPLPPPPTPPVARRQRMRRPRRSRGIPTTRRYAT
ncbi:transposase [Streptomyces venezuelae]|nr:transposase [Streptomyces venezuelae]